MDATTGIARTAIAALAAGALSGALAEAKWLYPQMALETYRLRVMREECRKAGMYAGHPGKVVEYPDWAEFRRPGTADAPPAYTSDRKTSMEFRDGRWHVRAMASYGDVGRIRAEPEGWEARTLPGGEWRECAAYAGDTPPHLDGVPDGGARLPLAEQSPGWYDCGAETLARIEVAAGAEPRAQVGESPAEARDGDEAAREQRVRFVRTGEDRWRTETALAFRYLRLETPAKAVWILPAVRSRGPRGEFSAPGERWRRLRDVGVRTLELCSLDFLVDGIKRDRLPWAGDLAVSLLASAYVTGDAEIVRRSLSVCDAYETDVNGIVTYSMWTVIAHDLYQRYFGDRAFLAQRWWRIRERLENLLSRCDEAGFVARGLDWVFIDWVEPQSATAMHAIWKGALDAGAALADRVGDDGFARRCREAAARVRDSLDRLAWDEKRGLYRTAPGGESDFARQPNIYAVVFGVADPARARAIGARLARRELPDVKTPYVAGWELVALARTGQERAFLDSLERTFGAMLDRGATTFWEGYRADDDGDGHYAFYGRKWGKSLCHVWSAWPAFVFVSEAMGVRPASDGWRTWEFKPLACAAGMSATVPVPGGWRRFAVSASGETSVAGAPPPAADFDIRRYGAAEDAAPGCNARAINAAIAAAAEAGGGRVTVPSGRFVSGTVRMRSNVELHLAEGAVLKGSTARGDYNRDDEFPENFHSEAEEWSGGHLILGVGLENVAFTGPGRIDGSGPEFFPEYPDYGSLFPCYKYGCRLHPTDREWFRPGPLFGLFRCRNVRLEGLTIVDTPCWTVHIRCSENIDIEGVRIFADRTIANSDGLSIDCCRNVRISGCDLRTGDDGIALRASCDLHAATNFCENIDIADCDIRSCCFGVRVGIGMGTIRNVKIRRCRVHEAGGAFGFTPAWIEGGKGVYIENVTVEDCHGADVERMASFSCPRSDARIRDIRFSNCRFASLLPSASGGGNELCAPENIEFVDCRRDFLRRTPVCHSAEWERLQGIRTFDFWRSGGEVRNLRIERCRPDPEPHGVLLLSFDDRNFADWAAALPLFERYDARATFYVSGDIAGPCLSEIRKIAAAGHSLGLHGYRHLDAPARAAAVGKENWYREEIAKPHRQAHVAWLLDFVTFAYPDGRSSEELDVYLTDIGWERVRGCSSVRPYDPEGKWRRDNAGRIRPLAEEDGVFVPYREMSARRRYDSVLVGEDYNTDIDEVCAAIRRAGERQEVLALSSHSIRPGAKGIHMKTEWLERMLATARECGVAVEGIDYFRRPDGFR